MNNKIKSLLLSALAVILIVVGYLIFPDVNLPNASNGLQSTDAGTLNDSLTSDHTETQTDEEGTLDPDGEYLSRDDVALYIHLYGKLPPNFLTKNEAKVLGWESSKGNLWVVRPGCAIGGDRFRNYEGQLPDAPGRVYYECDVNYSGGYRGAERIVFSNDGLVYYTADHYETFTLLYGGDGK